MTVALLRAFDHTSCLSETGWPDVIWFFDTYQSLLLLTKILKLMIPILFHPSNLEWIHFLTAWFFILFSFNILINLISSSLLVLSFIFCHCSYHCIVFVGSAVTLPYNVSDFSIVIGHSLIALLFHFTHLVFILLWQKLVAQLSNRIKSSPSWLFRSGSTSSRSTSSWRLHHWSTGQSFFVSRVVIITNKQKCISISFLYDCRLVAMLSVSACLKNGLLLKIPMKNNICAHSTYTGHVWLKGIEHPLLQFVLCASCQCCIVRIILCCLIAWSLLTCNLLYNVIYISWPNNISLNLVIETTAVEVVYFWLNKPIH